MMALDLDILHAVQSFAAPWLTTLMRLVSDLCLPEVVVPVFAAVFLVLLVKHRRLQEILLLLILSGNLLTVVLKPIIARPRPNARQATLYVHEKNFSIPSGHAMAAMTIGGAVLLLAARGRRLAPHWLIVVVAVFILLVGYSRIYLGAHWPSDILASYVLGWLWLFGMWHWVRPALEQRRTTARRP